MARYDHIVLPPVIQSLLAEGADTADVSLAIRLHTVGKFFSDQRDEDVEARAASGIEGVWLYCEEAYAGIDDANRHEFAGNKWTKPMTSEGPVSTERTTQSEGEIRSNAFVMLTARYVDAAAAKVSDIMLPQDDKPFSFKPTPVPDLIDAAEDTRQLVHEGVPLQRDATYAETLALSGQQLPMNELSPTMEPQAPIPVQPGQAPPMPLTVADLEEERVKAATKAATKAENIIYDWLVEGKFTRQMRAVNHDAARLGVGILKGPFPKAQKSMAVVKVQEPDGSFTWECKRITKLVPTYERKDPWNIYPAKDCGEDIHNGDHLYECEMLSGAQLRALKADPGYLPQQIELAIKEGPGRSHANWTSNPNTDPDDERFEVWYRYGTISREQFEIIECCLPARQGQAKRVLPKGQEDVYAILTMVNDRVIRSIINPSHVGTIPYHVKPWRRRAGHWAGIGVGEQVSLPQRGVNGAVRAINDNAGLSSGVQLIVDAEALEPADGKWMLTRNKVWRKKLSSGLDDMRKAITSIQIPSLQPQLQAIIDLYYRMAEDSSSIPLISQGQSGATSPETLGATQLQDNNANQLLRDQAHDFDQLIKLPMIEQTYEYLLLDPDVPNDAKGDFKIHISSAVALVEQALQDQFILQLFPSIQNAANPYRVNPAKLFAKLSKAKRLNPVEIQYSEDEWKRIESQPPPKDKSVQVAEVKAQADLQKAKMDTDRDTVYVQAETQRTQAEHESRMAELAQRERLAMLEYSNKHQISLEQLKADLAQTTMKLQVQQQLAAQDRSGETTTPPTEPAGRAPAGQSFEK